MRHIGNFNPEWGYLSPAPSLLRTARVFVVAVAIGATASAAVVFSLMDRPAAETSVAARTLVLSAEPSQAAREAQRTAQQPPNSARAAQAPRSESPATAVPQVAAVAAHASIAPSATNEPGAAPSPQGSPAMAALAESPRMMTADPPPALENNTAQAVQTAPAPAPAPVFKGAVKRPRAVARAAVPPRYDVPRYAAPRYESMQRGPYAFLRQYGSFGQEY
jgi:hypothetical protein